MTVRKNPTYLASGILFAASVAVFIITALTNRGDMTSAVLVLCGFMLLVTGVFILLTAERAPLPAFLTELMPVQGSINLARAFADLGVTSNTIHRCRKETGDVIQINPVTGGRIPELPEDTTFVTVGEWNGVAYPAVCTPLLQKLKKEDHLVIPKHNFEMLGTCLSEVFADYLAVAAKVSAVRNDKSVVITFEHFSPAALCRTMQEVSPKCCTMVGCPLCSLAAAILAEGEEMDVLSDSAVLEKDTLTLSFSLYAGVRV